MGRIKTAALSILEPILGKDGKLSGRRILGFLLVFKAMQLADYGVHNCLTELANITMLVGTFLGFAAALWGLTTFQSIKENTNSGTITE